MKRATVAGKAGMRDERETERAKKSRPRSAAEANELFGELERRIQREMLSVAGVLEQQRVKVRALSHRLQALRSYKAARQLSDDEKGWVVVWSLAGDLDICAAQLRENVESMRRTAAETPESLAAAREAEPAVEAQRAAERVAAKAVAEACRPGLVAQ